jgi:uncharacterized membrane protein SpoIIM required for sporulation
VTEDRFVAAGTARWAELGELISRAQRRGLSVLTGAEARRLGSLYRTVSTDLATARSLRLSEPTVHHVNRLCVAAHDLVYAGHRRGGQFARAGAFLAGGFPALVRRTWRWHAFAAALTIAAAVAAYVVFVNDPDLAERTLGTTFRDRAERAAAMPDDARRYLEVPDLYTMPLFSWGIMANNIRVTLACFALGAFFGVGTVLLLILNGVSVGGGLAVFQTAGVPGVLWTFIAGHGPLELTAIFIASGAGMRLGMSLILPGRLTRGAAFRESGLESVQLLLGTSAMLVVAGIIEGFVSPSAVPGVVKWSIGAATAAFMVWYFGRVGREPRGTAPDPA